MPDGYRMSYRAFRRGLILFSVVVFAGTIPASAEPKIHHHTSANRYEYGTDNDPIAVNIKSPPETDKATADENEQWNRGIGIAQTFIFLLQLVAFAAQACWMRSTVREMHTGTEATVKAANAARDSADAAIEAQRPWLELKIKPRLEVEAETVSDILRLSKALPVGGFTAFGYNAALDVVYELHNVGLSPAYKATVKGQLRVEELLSGWGDADKQFFDGFFRDNGLSGPTVLATKDARFSDEVFLDRKEVESLIDKGIAAYVYIVDAVVRYSYGDAIGETGVSYLITHAASGGGGLFSPYEGNIPADELNFTELPQLGYSI